MPSRDISTRSIKDSREKGRPIVRLPPPRQLHTNSAKRQSLVNVNTEPWIFSQSAPSLEPFNEAMALDGEFLKPLKRARLRLHLVAYPRYPEEGGVDSESESDYFCNSNIKCSPPSRPSVRPSYFHFQGILLSSSLDIHRFCLFHTPIDPGKPPTHRTLNVYYSKAPSSSSLTPKKPSLSIPVATITMHGYLERDRLAAALSLVQPSKYYVHDALVALVSAGFVGEHLANACYRRMTETISITSHLISRLEQSGYSLLHNNVYLGIHIVIKVLVRLAQAGIQDVYKAWEVLNLLEEIRGNEALGRYPTGDDEGSTCSHN